MGSRPASTWLRGRRSPATTPPDQLIDRTLTSDWILEVGRVAAETKVALEKTRNRDETLNEWASSNLKLQFVDPEYASRAGANNGHFLMTRNSDDSAEYLRRILAPDAEPSAIALYLYYHLGAMALAEGWATADASARPELARRILATEAFAIHFLEDSFAAGHVAGSWGNVAERKGTHDYYSEFGLDTSAWGGNRLLLGGDAHMRPEDLTRTGKIVGQSLRLQRPLPSSWPLLSRPRCLDEARRTSISLTSVRRSVRSSALPESCRGTSASGAFSPPLLPHALTVRAS